MENERLTLGEMEQKYPDEWLFIIDCEISENTELLSGVVAVHSKSEDDIHEASRHYIGGAAIHYTGKMPDPLRYQLEITDIKIGMWRELSG